MFWCHFSYKQFLFPANSVRQEWEYASVLDERWNDALSPLSYCQQSSQLNAVNEVLPQTWPSTPLVEWFKLYIDIRIYTTDQNVHSHIPNVLDDQGEGHWLAQIGLQSPGHDSILMTCSGWLNILWLINTCQWHSCPTSIKHTATHCLQLWCALTCCCVLLGHSNVVHRSITHQLYVSLPAPSVSLVLDIETASNPASTISCMLA